VSIFFRPPDGPMYRTMKGTVRDFYSEYHGHLTSHLELVHDALRQRHPSVIFFAGDSSLDNKYWVEAWVPAINGYESVLEPPRMKQDVCYWLNAECERRALTPSVGCLNTSIEATTLAQRACGLLPQDEFIRDHLTDEDFLVVSVGGNDIALSPVLCTVLNILPLVLCTPQCCLRRCACACPPNFGCDLGCAGCGIGGCVAGLFGWPPGVGYFVDLFGNKVENYVRKLLGPRRPRKVVVCMIYHPDEQGGGWADCALGALGYNRSPSRLQLAIATIFESATRRIRIPGAEVVALPLFQVLDGKDTTDYVARVEPSAEGGRKMGRAIADALFASPPTPAEGVVMT
jgi:hypothetical protein